MIYYLSRIYSKLTHEHGNIDKDGKIGNSTGKIITTGTNGVLQASNTITKDKISDFPTTMTPSSHTHPKSQKTDFAHTHTKGDITNFAHTHTASDLPASMTPSAHTHGDVTNDGKITTADTATVKKAVVTDNNNNIKAITKIPFANLNITKSNITGLGIPSSDTNTTYSAGTGLTLSGTTFNIDEAPATNIIHDTSETPLPNIAPGVTSAEIPQNIINQTLDNHTHLTQWEQITVPKGTLFVNKKLGLAEYIYDGNFAFGTANADVQFHNTRIIPTEYTPVYRIIQPIHFSTAGLTLAVLDPDGKIRGRSYSSSTKYVAIHFLYRYRKTGEADIPTNITV